MIDTLHKESNGGFGTYLVMAHEWTRPDSLKRHYELFADEVTPKFQSSATRALAAEC